MVSVNFSLYPKIKIILYCIKIICCAICYACYANFVILLCMYMSCTNKLPDIFSTSRCRKNFNLNMNILRSGTIYSAKQPTPQTIYPLPPGLLERLKAGETIICAEGYVFELERRGYLRAGCFVPEVVIEHPEVVRTLHEEFVHAGSDVVEALTVRCADNQIECMFKMQNIQ